MPKAGVTDDFTLSEFDGGNKFGLMSARARGRRTFSIDDARTILNRQLAMGELTEAELPAEIEQVWSADDWSLGIGGIVARNDPKKVAITTKVDTSEAGVIRLSREIFSTINNSDPDQFEPSGFALAPFDTGGTSALNPELWSFQGRDVYSGGSNTWVKETQPQDLDVYYQNGVQYGKWAVASARYGGSELADVAMPYIFKSPDAADWVVSSLTAGRFKYFVKARNVNGNEILWGGNHLFDTSLTLSGDHDSSDTTLTMSADPTGTIAANDIVLMGAAGAQELMLVISISTTQLTVVRGYGTAASDPAGGEKIYLYQPHVIKSSVEPTNAGSWDSGTKIGEDDQPITGLAVDGDSSTLFVTKTDGVYSHGFDENDNVVTINLTTEFRQFGYTGNFHNIYAWNGHILLPMGGGGLLDMDIASGVIRDISMSVLAPNQRQLHGRVLAMHGDPTNLFMLILDTTSPKLHLVLAQLVTFGGLTEFRYHVLQEVGAGQGLADEQCVLMIDTHLSNHRRVWIGFTETGVSVRPKFYAFGRLSTAEGGDNTDRYHADTDAEFITVEFDKNLPNVPMHVSSIEMGTRNLPGTGGAIGKIDTEFRMDRAVDGSGNAIYLEGPSFSLSPLQEAIFPHGTAGKVLELKIKPSIDTIDTQSPEIISIRVKWQIQPDPRKLIPMKVYIADGQLKLNGTVGGRPRKLLAQLVKWDSEPTDLVLGTPNDDPDRSVLFLPGTLKVREVGTEFGRRPEYEASFMLVEV